MEPKYFIWEETPMKFYRVLYVLLLISSILRTIIFVASVIPAIANATNWQERLVVVVGAVFDLALLVLCFLAIEGLQNRKWSGVQCYYGAFGLSSVILVADEYFSNGDLIAAGIQIIAVGLVFVLIYIYFEKRRPLFAPWHAAIPAEQYAQQEANMKHLVIDESTGEVISETAAPTSPEEPQPIVCTYQSDYKIPVPQQEEASIAPLVTPASPKWKIACIVLTALCVVSLAGNALQLKQAQDSSKAFAALKDEASDLHDQVWRLSQSLSSTREELDFFTGNIAFVVDGVYHNYNCSTFQREIYRLNGEFFACDLATCKEIGWSRCIFCLSYWP